LQPPAAELKQRRDHFLFGLRGLVDHGVLQRGVLFRRLDEGQHLGVARFLAGQRRVGENETFIPRHSRFACQIGIYRIMIFDSRNSSLERPSSTGYE